MHRDNSRKLLPPGPPLLLEIVDFLAAVLALPINEPTILKTLGLMMRHHVAQLICQESSREHVVPASLTKFRLPLFPNAFTLTARPHGRAAFLFSYYK